MDKFSIRVASINDIERMLEWAYKEGWNPGLADTLAFHITDPGGFFMGYLDNQPIASISVVRYPTNFAFLGFYIVEPNYRGLGYGFLIWLHGINFLEGYNIGLDGVIDQQKNYMQSGFRLAHRNIRFSGSIRGHVKKNVVNAKDIPFDYLLEYDRRYFPAPRPHFLAAWLAKYTGYVYLEDQKIKGFGVIRPCRTGYKIGPLYAETEEIAEELFFSLCSEVEDKTVFIDVPEINKTAMQLVERFQFKPGFETARMYRGEAPCLDWQKIIGVTTFELG